jgi:hypothetical protein
LLQVLGGQDKQSSNATARNLLCDPSPQRHTALLSRGS